MERRAITVYGIVQGVGFRPFVYGVASHLGLRGFVRNQTSSVLIEVEGESRSLDSFLAEITNKVPPLARIDRVSWERRMPQGEARFRIESSTADEPSQILICPDVATCRECLAELFDPADRRYRYPFLNCTHCGPRLTIITGAPYDRARTTMAAFVMCAACRAEYEDPANRRFHAQPTACPRCGPRLDVRGSRGEPIATAAGDPLAHFVTEIRAGKIGALKGLGGYHLACDARSESTVAELRRRKHRDEKPFAIMVRDLAAVEALCEVGAGERRLLESSRRPIVLLRKRCGAGVAEAVAPRNPYLGVMLPYTPLHHLLFDAMGSIPLVMTSGNRSDEPIAYEDRDALERLAGIADVFLVHNRPIHVRCDDSVTRLVDGLESPLRRSRGDAPQPIRLPRPCARPTLAVGGQFKGTFALGRGPHAVLSHHLGDLDHLEAYRAFARDIALYEQLFAVRPERIVHDAHPDYASTRYALERAAAEGMDLLAVQHHHAHMASCMAEHGLDEPVIGVTFDGTGFAADGTIWGGEFLVGDYQRFRREAHLRPVAMAGGDRAIREPWRLAVAHLADAGSTCPSLERRLDPAALRTIRTMLDRRFCAPLTSSAGRLFDAVASLAGVRDRVSHEGQAAMELEWLASSLPPDGVYPFELEETGSGPSGEITRVVDTRPLVRAVVEEVRQGIEPKRIARRFHSTVVAMIAHVCDRLREATGLRVAVLSGGVFMNALLTTEVVARLRGSGFRVYRHRQVPPNDGGLSLGQLAVAAAVGPATG
jgi:hydrogenase maturation protein HypF